MADKIILTPKGKEKLLAELDQLKKVKRPAVIQRIKSSKDYGDLSENAEYEDARNEQSFIEGRIQEIERMLKYAEVSQNSNSAEIGLGSVVSVKIAGENSTYEIVSSAEADPLQGKISIESPIGSALIGKKVGEKVTAQTPNGEVEIQVLSVG